MGNKGNKGNKGSKINKGNKGSKGNEGNEGNKGNIEINFDNGDRYIGGIVNGKKNGKGTYFFKDGSTYVGEYKNDVKEGKGKYFFASGNKYDGDFKNDTMNGKGTFFFAGGNKDDLLGGGWYIGNFVDGNFEGFGMLSLKKYIYSGYFKGGKKNGYGKLTDPDGTITEGEWVNDEFIDNSKPDS